MMNIKVQSVHFNADEKLITYIERKLQRLGKYFEREINAEVHLKLQDTSGQIKQKIAEVHLHVPGGWLVDKKSDLTFERAVDASYDTLKRQLIRHKEKSIQH